MKSQFATSKIGDVLNDLKSQIVTSSWGGAGENCPTLLLNKAYTCLQLSFEENLQSSKAYLLCVPFVKCGIT